MKLTKAQRRVLTTMLKYECTVYAHSGRGYHSAFFGHRCPHRENNKVRPRTVYALRKKGLIQSITPKDERWRGSRYTLTESGKAAIETSSK